ncbi:MAG: DUF924 family protein [Halioglobus sp.]
MNENINAIHAFWFGELDATGLCLTDHHALWFKSSEQTDDSCRSRFGELVTQALAGQLNRWTDSDDGLIALLILLDQFPRNIYRGTPNAFAGDAQALALAQQAIACKRHQRLPAIHRVFLYLPLEHTEDPTVQQACVDLFSELARMVDSAQFADFARYARAHQDVITAFGRFPHRNDILGRQSTPEEIAYLEKHGGF